MNAPERSVLGLAPDDLGWARAERARTGRAMVELLEERLALAPALLVARIAASVHLPSVGLDDLRAGRADFGLLPFAECQRRRAVAVRGTDGVLRVALADPWDAATRDWAEERITEDFDYAVAHPKELTAYLGLQEEGLTAMEGIGEAGAGVSEMGAASAIGPGEISIESIDASGSPVVRLVDATLYDALKAGASDIHLEATGTGLSIKYRIDGVLAAVKSVEGVEFAEHAISRVKVMSELDIAERRVPQDGRFRARVQAREVDFRVSIMPSVHGEDAVVRILDKRSLARQLKRLTLESLGFEGADIERLREISTQPHGMLLVTGPTGSGKTTTLYAVISEINQGTDKIVTIEDPVEYQLAGVLQIPVNEKKGLGFARGLRSILRHDPDRIMVGEIRDPETAEIAVQSALTGHLVYTTVHANSVFDVIGRFTHMGIDPFNLASALNAVLAQRLVRTICPVCATDAPPSEALLARSRIASAAGYRFRRGRGCGECRGTGFRGRRAVAELMVMTDDLRELLAARAPVRRLREAAQALGTRSLREAALAVVARGETTLEEANRVTLVAG